MEFWEAYECTILVQMYFHLRTCSLMTNEYSIAGNFVVTLAFEDTQVIPPFSREETFLGHVLNISRT